MSNSNYNGLGRAQDRGPPHPSQARIVPSSNHVARNCRLQRLHRIPRQSRAQVHQEHGIDAQRYWANHHESQRLYALQYHQANPESSAYSHHNDLVHPERMPPRPVNHDCHDQDPQRHHGPPHFYLDHHASQGALGTPAGDNQNHDPQHIHRRGPSGRYRPEQLPVIRSGIQSSFARAAQGVPSVQHGRLAPTTAVSPLLAGISVDQDGSINAVRPSPGLEQSVDPRSNVTHRRQPPQDRTANDPNTAEGTGTQAPSRFSMQEVEANVQAINHLDPGPLPLPTIPLQSSTLVSSSDQVVSTANQQAIPIFNHNLDANVNASEEVQHVAYENWTNDNGPTSGNASAPLNTAAPVFVSRNPLSIYRTYPFTPLVNRAAPTRDAASNNHQEPSSLDYARPGANASQRELPQPAGPESESIVPASAGLSLNTVVVGRDIPNGSENCDVVPDVVQSANDAGSSNADHATPSHVLPVPKGQMPKPRAVVFGSVYATIGSDGQSVMLNAVATDYPAIPRTASAPPATQSCSKTADVPFLPRSRSTNLATRNDQMRIRGAGGQSSLPASHLTTNGPIILSSTKRNVPDNLDLGTDTSDSDSISGTEGFTPHANSDDEGYTSSATTATSASFVNKRTGTQAGQTSDYNYTGSYGEETADDGDDDEFDFFDDELKNVANCPNSRLWLSAMQQMKQLCEAGNLELALDAVVTHGHAHYANAMRIARTFVAVTLIMDNDKVSGTEWLKARLRTKTIEVLKSAWATDKSRPWVGDGSTAGPYLNIPAVNCAGFLGSLFRARILTAGDVHDCLNFLVSVTPHMVNMHRLYAMHALLVHSSSQGMILCRGRHKHSMKVFLRKLNVEIEGQPTWKMNEESAYILADMNDMIDRWSASEILRTIRQNADNGANKRKTKTWFDSSEIVG